MTLLGATWVFTGDPTCPIIQDGGVVFEETILDVGSYETLKYTYPNAKCQPYSQGSVLMAGLINSHVHLEFSSNRTQLQYGSFMRWLYSVIRFREEIVERTTPDVIEQQLNSMLQTGTTTIGAISSYGLDLEACLNSSLNVVYFNEIIGSKMDMADTLLADFQARFNTSVQSSNDSFFPAVAIHSPYSVHPILIREALTLAKTHDVPVSAHFLESKAERVWLQNSEGEFASFFSEFFNQTQALTHPKEFLQQFEGIKQLSFTHCVEAKEEELLLIKRLNASINHCITSNRLLGGQTLDLDSVSQYGIPYTIGTDGLSSHYSLNLFDELRTLLMVHTHLPLNEVAFQLLHAVTRNGAEALGLQKGVLKRGYDADIIGFELPSSVKDEADVAIQIILHTRHVDTTIIGGVYV